MSRQAITAGRAFVDLILNDKKFLKPLRNASDKLKDMGSGIMGIGNNIAAAGSAMIAPFIGGVTYFAAAGDALDKMSQRLGVGAGALAEYQFAAEQSGSGIASIEKGFAGLSRTVYDAERGLSTAKDALGDLGLSAEQLRGMLPEDQFQMVADRLSEIEDVSLRGAIAQKVFGRAGRELLPMLGGLRDLRQEARDLELVPSEDSVKNAAEVTDAMNRVRRTFLSTFYEIGASVADTVLGALDYVKDIGVATTKWIKNNHALLSTIFQVGLAVAAIGTGITAIGAVVAGAGMALGGFVTILTTIGSAIAFILSPIGLISAALAAGVTYWALYTKSGQDAVSSLVDGFEWVYGKAKEVFGGISDALAAGDLMLAGEIAMAGLQVIFLKGLDALSSIFGDALGKIGGQILGGDFSEAWETAVLNMSAVWDGFVEGIVAVFTQASRAILGTWQKTVNAISNQLLEMSSEGGFLGSVANQIVGYDIAAQQAERDRLNNALGLGPENVLDQSQGFAAEFTGGTANKIGTYLDELDRNAQARTRESGNAANAANAGGANPALTAAEKNLADLMARSAAARAAKEEAQAKAEENKQATSGENTLKVPNVAEAGKSVFSTFSAAAFQAAGGLRSDPKKEEKQAVEELKETKAYIKRMAKAQEKGIVIGGY